jgi:hypothetical protein
MRRLLFCLLFLAGAALPAIAQDQVRLAEPAPAATATPDAGPAAATENLAGALEKVQARRGISWKQRRALGLTFRNVRKTLSALNADGDLEGVAASELPVMVLDRLVDDNPRAYATAELDWDAILNFLERLIPLILRLIELFGAAELLEGAAPWYATTPRPLLAA